ncbi:MAG: heme-copper oxidase subunit III [Candidatus Kapaibacterium sp.]
MSDLLYEEHGLAAGELPSAPVLVDSGRFVFFIALALDVILFGTFTAGYFFLRASAPAWPPADLPHLQTQLVGVATISITVATLLLALTVFAQNRNALRLLRGSLVLALVFLAGFLAMNAIEWRQLIATGLPVRTVFGGIYFVLTGLFHLHIIACAVYILSKYRWTLHWRRYTRSAASIAHLSYFMDAMLFIWLGIYYAIYL